MKDLGARALYQDVAVICCDKGEGEGGGASCPPPSIFHYIGLIISVLVLVIFLILFGFFAARATGVIDEDCCEPVICCDFDFDFDFAAALAAPVDGDRLSIENGE